MWRFGDGPGPAHSAEGGRHEELAAPTCAVPAQAAELDRLGNIRPRPAPLVKVRINKKMVSPLSKYCIGVLP